MKLPDTQKIIQIVYFTGFIIALIIVYKILSSIGIIKTASKKRSEAEKDAAVKMLRTDEYFSPVYFKGKTFKSIGANAANLYAQQLRKYVRGFGTDEEGIYSVFGKLYNKCNVSEIAGSYYLQFGRDLQTDLLNDLTDKEVVSLMNIINGLPNQ
jgi:hypothetical protein